MVGFIEVCPIDRDNRSGTLGRVALSEAERGARLGEALVREAVRIGFAELRLRRIGLVVFEFNAAAIGATSR
jgi:RimJ/RimL family protein N-acetyltransferase